MRLIFNPQAQSTHHNMQQLPITLGVNSQGGHSRRLV